MQGALPGLCYSPPYGQCMGKQHKHADTHLSSNCIKTPAGVHFALLELGMTNYVHSEWGNSQAQPARLLLSFSPFPYAAPLYTLAAEKRRVFKLREPVK